jgi:tetratricopeptide (TPR) repeat protein
LVQKRDFIVAQHPPTRRARDGRDLAETFQRAVTFHQAGQYPAAEQLYQAVLQAERVHPGALCNLGLIRLSQNRHEEALRLIRKVLYAHPNAAEALLAFALVLQGLNQHQQALAQFQKAVVVRPDFVEAHIAIAITLQALHRHDEALVHAEKAAALAPNQHRARCSFGTALRIAGRIDEACGEFERAIALAPRSTNYYRLLSETRHITVDDPLLAAMQALASDIGSLNEQGQIDLHFALGKAYGDLRQYEQSIEHLLAGNALKRKQFIYDEANVLRLFEQTKALLTAEVIEERSGLGDPSTAPIFIVGMPRSGSTLTEQILVSHPDVHAAGEVLDFMLAVKGLDGGGALPADVGGEELRQMGARYLERLHSRVPVGARYITDKMLGNSRLVGLIHLALPNARIIHVRRNPIDNCLSCFSILFAGGQGYSYYLGELGRFWRAHEAIIQHWRNVLPEGVMLEVQYEDLVADLETHARRIVAHCRLDWNDACLEFYKTERPVQTASVVQVRQPIYRSSIGRWEPYKEMLRPLLDALEIQ